MQQSENFKFGYILPNETSKELKINQNTSDLDGLIVCRCKDFIITLPNNPVDGDVYIISPSATGDLIAERKKIVIYNKNFGWRFITPKENMTFFVIHILKVFAFVNNEWKELIISTDAQVLLSGLIDDTKNSSLTQTWSIDKITNFVNAIGQAQYEIGDYKYSAQLINHGKWLKCDGSAISRTTYNALFAIIGTSFGVGNGSTTFDLPDFRGRVPVGIGQGIGLTNRALGAEFGAETHTLTIAQMPEHNHALARYNNQPNGWSTGTSFTYPDTTSTNYPTENGTGQTKAVKTMGGGGSHNNIQPSLTGGNWFIRY